MRIGPTWSHAHSGGWGRVMALPTHLDSLGGQSGCAINIGLLIPAPDSSQQTAHPGRGLPVPPCFLSRLVPAGAQQSLVWRPESGSFGIFGSLPSTR